MSKINFKVNIEPDRVIEEVKRHQNAELVHEELHDLGDGKQMGTLVFEKYFFRTKNRAALVVIVDNIHRATDVRVVATGSSQGLIFNFDWGAGDSFAGSVEDILREYLIE
ncbi:MAG TPA: DUF6054 family protein [Bacilli bacterium]|nr:DUF6054 family protein [Bacilli bacterium]